MIGTIKRFVTAVGIAASFSVTAQDYTFDYLITSEQQHLNSETYEVYPNSLFTMKHRGEPVNSQNQEIKFGFDQGMGGEQIAVIQDGNRQLRHYFKVIKDPGYGGPGFRLEYLRTKRYKKKEVPTGIFTIEQNSPLIYDIRVDVNETKKHHLTLNLVESDADLLNTFIIDGGGNIEPKIVAELKKKLDPEKNYLVSEYVSRYIPGATFHKSNVAKKINFTVNLPKTRRVQKMMGN